MLAIETSCDDTACAILDGAGRVLSSIVASQLVHRPFGGVVPELASREHLRNWPEVSAAALGDAGVVLEEIDVVAATRGPGLVGALLVGLSLGKGLAYGLGREFHGLHHMEAHLFSPFLRTGGGTAEEPPRRFTGLVVSGGHTLLLGVDRGAPGEEALRIATLAETRDDAIGEAFDKVGKRFGLPYPQGPRVDRLAELGDAARFPLPVAARSDDLFFSYSGLKSQTLLELDRLTRRGVDTAPRPDDKDGEMTFGQEVLDLLAGFRAAAVAQLFDRLERLHRREPIELLAVSGGVAANRLLRREVGSWCEAKGVEIRLVPTAFCGDNAAMIAWRAILNHRAGLTDDPRRCEAVSRLPFDVR